MQSYTCNDNAAKMLDVELTEYIRAACLVDWDTPQAVVTFPMLNRTASFVRSIHATEAAVERAFSGQGLVHSDLRGALSIETLNALMFVRINRTAVE
jgi:hypothetical protein